MKTVLPSLILASLTLISVACANNGDRVNSPATSVATPADSAANAEQEVRKVHQEYDLACLQQNAASFERLLADDYTLTDPIGTFISKAEVVARAKAGEVKMEVGHSENVKVRVYGNMALVTGRWIEKSLVKGNPFAAGKMQNTTVYHKQNGVWQIVADQVTPITPLTAKP